MKNVYLINKKFFIKFPEKRIFVLEIRESINFSVLAKTIYRNSYIDSSMAIRNHCDDSEMTYQPGEIVKTGNRVYQADCFGILIPQAKNKQYLSKKAKMIAQMKENAKNGRLW